MLIRVGMAVADEELRENLSTRLEDHKTPVIELPTIGSVMEILQTPADVIIIDEERIPPPTLDSVRLMLNSPTPPLLIVLTDADRERQAGLLACGCEMVLSRKVSNETICQAVQTVLRKFTAQQNIIINSSRITNAPSLSDFVSKSQSMRSFIQLVRKVIHTDSSLLILGETGVGKERLAQMIHAESRRREYPFVPVNCAAIPENLLESELFGHERGAFTGAVKSRKGAFEQAHRGTLFLDEIGDFPLQLQAKLLRVLQERQFVKVGGENPVRVDVRVMAATNRNLAAEVKRGAFRTDIFYRLSVITLNIPPLQERREDIPELVSNYISYLGPRIGVGVRDIDPSALEALVNYSWPGNVRELINVIERAMLLCESGVITLKDLPEEVCLASPVVGDNHPKTKALASLLPDRIDGMTLKQFHDTAWRELEREYLRRLLEKSGGDVTTAAAMAGIGARSFYYKLRGCGMNPPRRRKAAAVG